MFESTILKGRAGRREGGRGGREGRAGRKRESKAREEEGDGNLLETQFSCFIYLIMNINYFMQPKLSGVQRNYCPLQLNLGPTFWRITI